ncbi:MAG: hypothetical protein IJS59_01600 [Bacteroidaceae bacterium]|nr:hypothetical protein [Bacteroidaceae bacterium]
MLTKHLLPILLALPLAAVAQPRDTLFTVDVQLLTRGELRNGGMTYEGSEPPTEDRAAFILDRERLILGYRRNWLELKASAQHVGIWGHEGASGLSLYEAWVRVTAPFGLFAQVGRMALRYDDERVMGPDDWSMTAMTHDALRLGYEGHGHKAHAILAYNQNLRATKEPGSFYSNGSRPYKSMPTPC